MAEVIVNELQLTIIMGATFSMAITWKDEADVLVPLPVGTVCEVKVREYLEATAALARFHTTPSPTEGLITLTDPGVTTLSMTATNTALLQPFRYAVWDIKYTFSGGFVIILLENGLGRADIRQAVTRT